MKKIITMSFLLVIFAWSAPDVDKFAKIFGQDVVGEKINGYIDAEGKLWTIGIKWYSKKVISGVYVPDGKESPEYSAIRTVPYLYFWLYDRNGAKIKEGALGDSVESATLIPTKNNSALVILRIQTDIGVRMTHPTSGYLILMLLDNNGVVKQKKKLTQARFENFRVHEVAYDYEGNIYLTLVNGIKSEVVRVYFDDEKVYIEENVELLPTTETHTLNSLKNKILPHYDIESQEWQINFHNLSTSYLRKFENFDLYPLESYPWMIDEYEPEFQSVRLNNGNIIITVFMKEDEQPVAYQILYDSLGRYIRPEETDILKPKDVKNIPDRSDMYIKRESVNLGKGTYERSTDVYIWGYDRTDGMLYWKKYRVD